MKKLTVKQIDEALLKLMDENPEYVYIYNKLGENAVCSYYEGLDPDCDGCVFGQALQSLDVTKYELRNIKQNCIKTLRLPILPNERPDHWVFIQFEQDNGVPWGKLKKYMPI